MLSKDCMDLVCNRKQTLVVFAIFFLVCGIMNEDLQGLMKSIIVVIITVKKIAESFIGKVFQGQKYSTYKKIANIVE